MLDRPRHSRGTSGANHEFEHAASGTVRQRKHSESEGKAHENKVSFVVDTREEEVFDDCDESDVNGKMKPKRSTDVQELLRRGFGSVRRSLDVV